MSRGISEGTRRLSLFLGGLGLYVFEVGFVVFYAAFLNKNMDQSEFVAVAVVAALGGGGAFMLFWGLVRAVAWVVVGFRKD